MNVFKITLYESIYGSTVPYPHVEKIDTTWYVWRDPTTYFYSSKHNETVIASKANDKERKFFFKHLNIHKKLKQL